MAFIVDETFSTISGEEIPNIFQIVVEKATDDIEPFDLKVSKTIENIIDKFFEKVENSLVYICSNEYQKAVLRHKIFDRWYMNSEYKSSVVKIDNVLHITINPANTVKLHTSFLFHKNNSNYEKLIHIYSKIENVLNQK